jgi:hypothetical protein
MTTRSSSVSSIDVARMLVDVADTDTVYRDVYLPRARAFLAHELTVEQYRGYHGVQQQIEKTVAASRAATALADWKLVQQLAQQADELRRAAQAQAALIAIGELVYEAPAIAIDPFSLGLAATGNSGAALGDLRDKAVAALAKLATADPEQAAFYEARHRFLSGLAVAPRRPDAADDGLTSTANLERLAYEAAQRGDVAELKRLAGDILAQQATQGAKTTTDTADAVATSAGSLGSCPVDLGVPFTPETVARARTLGLAVVMMQPDPQAGPLIDYVTARMAQPALPAGESEYEGTMRIEALVDRSALPSDVAESAKTLVAQFVHQTFVNSGGARYSPPFAAEAVLVEDFPEDAEPSSGALVEALGIRTRRGLARDDIETALLASGPAILEDQLGLDPKAHKLVCLPPDVYARFGRECGWGRRQQWTHLDGYQVLKSGRLRALVGGDVRYGGVTDLTSIAGSDRRDSVVARFAVVRRSRLVARWR